MLQMQYTHATTVLFLTQIEGRVASGPWGPHRRIGSDLSKFSEEQEQEQERGCIICVRSHIMRAFNSSIYNIHTVT